MGKQVQEDPKVIATNKKSKVNRFDVSEEPTGSRKKLSSEAVVYIGHLPHGFYEDQLKSYFTQYGQVLGVKVARSKKTARSKGYGFVQFTYPEIAKIVANAMNGYFLMNKVLVAHPLPPHAKNPFSFPSSAKYQFINWKRIFIQRKNRQRTQEELLGTVDSLLAKEAKRRQRLAELNISYQYPGYAALIK